jgi:hypothetical protein
MTYARTDLSMMELEAQEIIELPTRELLHVVRTFALFTASAGGGGGGGAVEIEGDGRADSSGGSGGDASILTLVLPLR